MAIELNELKSSWCNEVWLSKELCKLDGLIKLTCDKSLFTTLMSVSKIIVLGFSSKYSLDGLLNSK